MRKRGKNQGSSRWWNVNAASVWQHGDERPTFEETKRHAKGVRRKADIRNYFRNYRANKKTGGGHRSMRRTVSSDAEASTESESADDRVPLARLAAAAEAAEAEAARPQRRRVLPKRLQSPAGQLSSGYSSDGETVDSESEGSVTQESDEVQQDEEQHASDGAKALDPAANESQAPAVNETEPGCPLEPGQAASCKASPVKDGARGVRRSMTFNGPTPSRQPTPPKRQPRRSSAPRRQVSASKLSPPIEPAAAEDNQGSLRAAQMPPLPLPQLPSGRGRGRTAASRQVSFSSTPGALPPAAPARAGADPHGHGPAKGLLGTVTSLPDLPGGQLRTAFQPLTNLGAFSDVATGASRPPPRKPAAAAPAAGVLSMGPPQAPPPPALPIGLLAPGKAGAGGGPSSASMAPGPGVAAQLPSAWPPMRKRVASNDGRDAVRVPSEADAVTSSPAAPLGKFRHVASAEEAARSARKAMQPQPSRHSPEDLQKLAGGGALPPGMTPARRTPAAGLLARLENAGMASPPANGVSTIQKLIGLAGGMPNMSPLGMALGAALARQTSTDPLEIDEMLRGLADSSSFNIVNLERAPSVDPWGYLGVAAGAGGGGAGGGGGQGNTAPGGAAAAAGTITERALLLAGADDSPPAGSGSGSGLQRGSPPADELQGAIMIHQGVKAEQHEPQDLQPGPVWIPVHSQQPPHPQHQQHQQQHPPAMAYYPYYPAAGVDGYGGMGVGQAPAYLYPLPPQQYGGMGGGPEQGAWYPPPQQYAYGMPLYGQQDAQEATGQQPMWMPGWTWGS
ncbi:hypothetical protein HYH03_018032 [Edaphochlamys debaryana]|uniref:Uncharacterized protein n=1 Tax=Edaphochlamys debaryana TaxID=47281 RepID=A0A835XMZ2_9CHLO|nr:hypothetical protein HYH03_018032 [Edaphochlamys debaryana]|eukprot:KAG2483094.1 hypothetical protein HYH03_018032 [Edaphochlamys debaryana]